MPLGGTVKRILGGLLSLCLVVTAAAFGLGGRSADGQCSPIRYAAYVNANYNKGVSFCVSENDFSGYRFSSLPWDTLDDAISSVKVFSGTVEFYRDKNYVYILRVYGVGNYSYVGDAYNDRFSSAWNGYQ